MRILLRSHRSTNADRLHGVLLTAGRISLFLRAMSWYNCYMEPVTTTHIESIPGKCGGKPCIAGTRIRVWDVYVLHERQGKSADEVVAAYPELSLADVYAALSYYFDHKAEIDAEMKAADEFAQSLKQATGPGPLARKLASTDAGSDSVSS